MIHRKLINDKVLQVNVGAGLVLKEFLSAVDHQKQK